MTVSPAAENTGIVFRRIDLGEDAVVKAVAENVSQTSRSTTLSSGNVDVHTVEHLLSALTGCGIDNALIDLDNAEVPILDGSAEPYVSVFKAAAQDAERVYFDVPQVIEIRDEKSGSWVRIEPAKTTSYEVTVDFGSKVLGVQNARWNGGEDYSSQIAPCRTFVFFHELEFLFANNLIKGGDVDNAIVIVEHPVTQEQLDRMTDLFGQRRLTVSGRGYLDNLTLHFPNECGRHKLLDLIGDLRLGGAFLHARVSAFKPGHSINTKAAAAIRALMAKKN